MHIFTLVIAVLTITHHAGAFLRNVRPFSALENSKRQHVVLTPLQQHSLQPNQSALEFLSSRLTLPKGIDVVATSSHRSTSTHVTHVYACLEEVQTHTPVLNSEMQVHLGVDGSILSYSLLPQVQLQRVVLEQRVSAQDAIFVLVRRVYRSSVGRDDLLFTGGAFSVRDAPTKQPIHVTKATCLLRNGIIGDCWKLEWNVQSAWLHAQVAVNDPTLISLANSVKQVRETSYTVVSFGHRDAYTDGLQRVDGPLGWHHLTKDTITTVGNNVLAQENWIGQDDADAKYANRTRPIVHKKAGKFAFDFPMDAQQDPKDYINASITNAFYWGNVLHDLYYSHGFTEEAGNFQQNNLDKGGKGGDPMIIHVQDGSELARGSVTIPPDGQPGIVRLFTYTDLRGPTVYDAALGADVLVHELTHGMTERLVGGPSTTLCMQYGDSGGMGEGFSDFFAVLFQMNGSATSPNIGIGNWLNNGVSLRRHPFSTNMAINPTTYGLINTDYWEWHDIGEIWGNILYGVYWALQQATGKFCNDWHTPGTTCANSLVIRMVIESLKLLPCNPSFVDGRNALLQAEQLLTHGKHECAIWRVFAKRGVGVDAVYGPWHIDEGFALPTTCQ